MSYWSKSPVNRRQRDILGEAIRQVLEEDLHPGELYEVIEAVQGVKAVWHRFLQRPTISGVAGRSWQRLVS